MNLCSNRACDQSFIMRSNQSTPKSETEQTDRNDSKLINTKKKLDISH